MATENECNLLRLMNAGRLAVWFLEHPLHEATTEIDGNYHARGEVAAELRAAIHHARKATIKATDQLTVTA